MTKYEYDAPVQMDTSMNEKFREVYVGDLTLWFSYSTIVAFAVPGLGRRKTDKKYSNTTQRHLNSIAGQTIPAEQFDRELEVVFDEIKSAMEDVSRRIVGALAE